MATKPTRAPAAEAAPPGEPLPALDAVLADHALFRRLFDEYEALCGCTAAGDSGGAIFASTSGAAEPASAPTPASSPTLSIGANTPAGSSNGAPTVITTADDLLSQAAIAAAAMAVTATVATAAAAPPPKTGSVTQGSPGGGPTHGSSATQPPGGTGASSTGTSLQLSESEKAKRRERKGLLVGQIVRHLTAHASAEERTLYPLVYDVLPYGKDMYEKALVDNQLDKEQMQLIITRNPRTDEEWEVYDAAVLELAGRERRHMELEERMVIAPLRTLLSPDAMLRLGQDWHVAKASGPLWPHPRGPTTAAAARLLHPITGAADRATEWLRGLLGRPRRVAQV